MTEATEPTPPGQQPGDLISTPTGGHAERVSTVASYLQANRDRFTEEALIRAARDRGYPDDVLVEARARARGSVEAAPTLRRARRWILAAYLLTFAVLTIGMFASEYSRRYGGHVIGAVILAALLGLALLISWIWLRSRAGKGSGPATGMAVLLSVPIVLLVIVAGLCIATGYPIPRPY